MVDSTTATLLSVALVSIISLIGALFLASGPIKRHGVLIFLVGLAAGALLGDAFIHLLPEAVEVAGGFELHLTLAVLLGFLSFFILEVALRWGHAHAEAEHDHDHAIAPFGVLNLIGDGVHNLIDGILVAAAYVADFQLGVATTIAVVLHEVPQELGDFGVLIRAGFKAKSALALNFASALLAFVGAGLVLLLPLPESLIEEWAPALIAGGFVYIASADLIPELHDHQRIRHRIIVWISLVVGMFGMYGLVLLE